MASSLKHSFQRSFPGDLGNFVVFDPKRLEVSSREHPRKNATKLLITFTSVYRIVSLTDTYREFGLIKTDGDEGWVRLKHVYPAARIVPKDPKREQQLSSREDGSGP